MEIDFANVARTTFVVAVLTCAAALGGWGTDVAAQAAAQPAAKVDAKAASQGAKTDAAGAKADAKAVDTDGARTDAAGAKADAKGDVPPLPETLTHESVRELLSRLSDAQVRSLLLDQLDRAVAAPTKAAADSGTAAMAGMAGTVDQHAGAMRDRYGTLFGAFLALPASVGSVAARVAAPATAGWSLAAYVAALLVTGWIAERIYVFAVRRYRLRLRDAPVATFSARAFQLGVGLLLDLGALAVFGIAAIVFFFALWLADDLRRIVVLEVLFIVVVLRVVALVARFLLAKDGSGERLLPLADAPSRTLQRAVLGLAAVFGVGVATLAVLTAGGASAETNDVVAIAFWVLGLVLGVSVVWRVRAPIADLIRGDGSRGTIVGWLADLWPVAATAYLIALLLGAVFNLLAGTPIATGTGFASVMLVVALPIVDMALCRALAAAAASRREDTVGMPHRIAAYESVLRRGIHIVVVAAGALLIARLWDVDPFVVAQRSLGGKIASSLFGIGLVLLATYMLWEFVKAGIDRRLVADDQPGDVPATRLRTVLPIVRATILVTIVVMAVMSVLAALGIDILPLLAGASIIGVAIGFGSQTLVRDIVSGAFFLMDDAFRLGEYIEVGDAKGRVEKIHLRSVFLRHHRGAINILPYGEIRRLRNTSRDWQVHVLEFRLTYDTSLLQVKKIMKKIGEDLVADPDYAPDIIQTLKSAGVMAAEDSAIVVRAKFTSRPTNNAWVVRRVAYDKIIRAFRDAGIRFAHREVTVNVPEGGDAAATTAAAGAALALDKPGAAAKEKAPQT